MVLARDRHISSSSGAQSCLTLCNMVDCSKPGFPVHHQLLEFTQTHVHRLCDAIQPSHPLLSPSPPAFSLSQHQGLFQEVSSSHQVAKVLASTVLLMNIQGWSPLGWTGWISSQFKGLSESSPTPQFKSINFWCSAFFIVQLWPPHMTVRGRSTLRNPICCNFLPLCATSQGFSVPYQLLFREWVELHAVLRTEIMGKGTCLDSFR